MIYVTFERGDSKFSNVTARALERSPGHSRAAASVESKMATRQHKNLCVREFIKTESPTAVQRAFRLRFNIQPQTRNIICRWNHQFEQIGCLCKDKSSGRPLVSEENVRRIEESFERSPLKSTRRASIELRIPQPTVWRVLRRRSLFESIFLNHPVPYRCSICAPFVFLQTSTRQSNSFQTRKLLKL